MVSTRPKSRFFEKGEKVLCYEPDPTKAKVLYDSKILGRFEAKDRRGRKIVQYKVHFQGWSSTWDRKVNADFVLKDTEENRQLQRDLAEKAQLQLGAYLYRKDRGVGKKRPRKPDGFGGSLTGSGGTGTGIPGGGDPTASRIRARVLSDDNCSSGSNLANDDGFPMKDDCETESCCSSVEGLQDEERVVLNVSERLQQYLEHDYDMVVNQRRLHTLPSRMPVVAILENFVKHTALKLCFSTAQTESTRRRAAQRMDNKREREFDKLVTTIGLLKEVADGIRIYFEFTLSDYLLYNIEQDTVQAFLDDEHLNEFVYKAPPGLSPDLLQPPDSDFAENHSSAGVAAAQGGITSATTTTAPTTTAMTTAALADSLAEAAQLAAAAAAAAESDEPQKRKLRSYRSDDCDLILESCLSSIAASSSEAAYVGSSVGAKLLQPLVQSLSPQCKDFLENLLAWRILPDNAEAVPSMIFGAAHLGRLLVKLPEFLNASSMADEKLKPLLQHLDTFVSFLESRKEWFSERNYDKEPLPDVKKESTSEGQQQLQAEQLAAEQLSEAVNVKHESVATT